MAFQHVNNLIKLFSGEKEVEGIMKIILRDKILSILQASIEENPKKIINNNKLPQLKRTMQNIIICLDDSKAFSRTQTRDKLKARSTSGRRRVLSKKSPKKRNRFPERTKNRTNKARRRKRSKKENFEFDTFQGGSQGLFRPSQFFVYLGNLFGNFCCAPSFAHLQRHYEKGLLESYMSQREVPKERSELEDCEKTRQLDKESSPSLYMKNKESGVKDVSFSSPNFKGQCCGCRTTPGTGRNMYGKKGLKKTRKKYTDSPLFSIPIVINGRLQNGPWFLF